MVDISNWLPVEISQESLECKKTYQEEDFSEQIHRGTFKENPWKTPAGIAGATNW